jgi:DNA-binding NarL/FixJ family response regulator
MTLRIVICCSNNLFAEGLKNLLAKEPGIAIIGIFHGKDLLSELTEARGLRPDILLLDSNIDLNILLSLPHDFFALGHVKVLMIGDRSIKYIINKNLQNLISKGIVGILPPSADAELLRKALKAILMGELWLDRSTLMKLMACMKQASPHVRLAHREKEIISHICQGYKNKEIAQKLQISEQTVKSHCNRIYKKLGVTDRLQLALYSHKIMPDENNVGR